MRGTGPQHKEETETIERLESKNKERIKEEHEGVYSVFPQALNSQLEKKSVI